jgi:hypothetical protein
MPELNYAPDGETLAAFMLSDAFVRGIRGPIGSGKSVCAGIELFRRACQQRPGPDGIRRTKGVAIRNTQPELKTTTIATWLQWFPEAQWGKFNWQPPFVHRVRVGDIDFEMWFLALDYEEDVKKLYSLDVTFGWINEARFVPKIVVDTLIERIGRFPRTIDGGPTWSGLVMDTNAMDPDHWWPIVAGDVPLPEDIPEEEAAMLQKPDNWRFFNQPPAMLELRDEAGRTTGWEMNPRAENLRYLPPGYYENLIRGKTASHIRRNVGNRLVVVKEGKAVYTQFNEDTHCSPTPLPILPRTPVDIGLDFGLTPAAVLSQDLRGRRLIQRELVATSMGMETFGRELRKLLARDYPDCPVTITGDPAGDQRAQTDEQTPFMILNAQGLLAVPAHSNDFTLRIEAAEAPFKRMVEGKPGLLIDPSCRHFRKACAGGYHFPRIAVSGGVRHAERPLKNQSSHVAEAYQYLCLGIGEGTALLRPPADRQGRVVQAKRHWNVYERGSRDRNASLRRRS